MLGFTVTLSRAAGSSLTVDYATSDGTATAGADYTAASGTLTIGAGSSSASIDVAVIDDEHNEGSETFTLTLSNASSGELTDATATGTITNHDALPKALLARFGRTAAVHVVEQVEARVNAPRAPGFDGQVAGRQINRDMGKTFAVDLVRQLAGGRAGGMGVGLSGPDLQPASGMPASGLGAPSAMADRTTMRGRQPSSGLGIGLGLGGREQLLGGSSFALNRATGGGVLSLWSHSASSSFAGQDGALALGGDVRSTMFGADYARERMITGVSLAHTRGLGTYAGVDSGQMTSAVTGLYPWIGFKASERVTVWTVAGYGAGGLMLQPGTGTPVETGLSMAMVAGGGRGEIVANGEGFELAFQGRRALGRDAVGSRFRRGREPRFDAGRSHPPSDRDRRLAEHDARRQDGAHAERRDRSPPGRRRRRSRAGPRCRRGARAHRWRHGPGGRLPGAPAARPSGGRLRREWDGRLGELRPDTGHAPGPHGPSVAVVGRRSHKRRRGALGRGNDGRHERDERSAARWRQRRAARQRGRLRPADRPAVRRHAADRPADIGVRPRLPRRVRVQVLEEGRLQLQVGIEAERRVSPVFGFGHNVAGGGGADQRVLGQASVEW